ncbi:hypothetical protein GALMADRAFT_369987 [Galerina marginata CBS 339.88]|uniref:Uncharacterized protein n=1 Tax=Galerina marginata (strain CBS 339.88) TaxID=685588 RepID=A0A067TTC2_GALM3|nr:hypothetical protein GALMADRAFT_369987 [Galerina marginata CBS 339.88]
MLALRPPPQDFLVCRGRSRQVSDSALARQASEDRRVGMQRRLFTLAMHSERTHTPPTPLHSESRPTIQTVPIASPVPKKAAYAPPFMRSASPSPPSSASMSPDYYDSPPSPPRSLEDQVHVAYALDDIHLAKILLLRLKGIEVTSDDDPRIAAVQDEDFDFCFVPNGGLLDERDEKAMREMQAREVERMEERRRQERLRHCERKWEEEKRRLREERMAVLRRREKKRLEDDDRRRKIEEQESRRAAEEERRRAKARASRKFVYDFPFKSSCSSRTPPVPSRSAPPPHSFDDSASISFTDVLKSMQGPLFPVSHDEHTHRAHRSPTRSRSRTRSQPKRRREDRLLDALLVEIEYSEDERRKRKGKQRAQPPRRSSPPCLACTAPSPPPLSPALSSSSSSSIPRTSSWLSFRTSSASSSSTDLTTPSSSSPVASPKSSWFSSSRPKSWLSEPIVSTSLPHSCRPHSRLTPVAIADGPLPIDGTHPPKSAPISHPGRQRSTSTVRAAKEGAGVLVRRMSKFVELAKGLQNAYVTAALFSVSASYDSFEDRVLALDMPDSDKNRNSPQEMATSLSVAQAPSRSTTMRGAKPKLRLAGYRVSALDVAAFLDPTQQLFVSTDDVANASPTPRYIPLTSPYPPTEAPRTILPDPLPYKLVFQPVPSPSRSPFRFNAGSELHTMYPSSDPTPAERAPGQVSWRIRSVGNPVHLRLKALHNIVWRRGVQWEGVARETALGGGRERVVGVAYEGVGGSSLSRSSSPSSMS